MYLRSAFPCVIEQNLVEFRTFDLEGCRTFRAKTIFEIEADFAASASRGDFGPIFADEPRGIQLRHEAEALEGFHAKGQQGFADMEAWKLFALEDGYLAPCERERSGGDAAGGASANDCYIVECNGHLSISAVSSASTRAALSPGWALDVPTKLEAHGGADLFGHRMVPA